MKILITGGTGTFGQAAARRFVDLGHQVTIYSRDEQKQVEMADSFGLHECQLRFFLGDVRDHDRLVMAMRGHTHVVHAAALKIVPKLEFDPIEAVRTNIDGTVNVVKAALECAGGGPGRRGTEQALLLSTDKAVEPANLYGSTKKVAEHLFKAGNNLAFWELPRFNVVRYGNVWGSRGSVLELWDRQRVRDGVIQVTDPAMTRYFMTASQAVDLVIGALSTEREGRTFVPMAPAYSMDLLAAAYTKAYQCEVRVIGSRPGEKVHESLISEDEVHKAGPTEDSEVVVSVPIGSGSTATTDLPSLRSSADAKKLNLQELKDLITERAEHGAAGPKPNGGGSL